MDLTLEKPVRDIASIGRQVRHLEISGLFTQCSGVAVMGCFLFFAQFHQHEVLVVDADTGAEFIRCGRLGSAVVGRPPRFCHPCGVAVNEEQRLLYVANPFADCVVVVRMGDWMVEAVWDNPASDEDRSYYSPCSLAYCPDMDLLYVPDTYKGCVKVLRGSDGQCVQVLGAGVDGNGVNPLRLFPEGVAVDNHHVYVAYSHNHCVLVYSKQDGEVLFQLGHGEGFGDTRNPVGVSVDSEAGVVYVADAGNYRVAVYRSCDGSYLRHFNVLQEDHSKAKPSGVMWDAAAGVLYVTLADSSSICVYEC
eukprot:TRINITY_DN6061_c0_g6_i1.p1 TRINITY_DN6061_c0_g6~~TRINITY_DN6061_c0_g6_i1.p1  ORF type:complete len:355 (+),score=54.97 TRINITY_DN6061_c0_g6_i1:149-1066(+)